MDDLNIQAGVTVNAEQADRAFTNLGDKAQKMANEVTKAADKAGKATDGMGDGAEKSADKFTRAESRMRSAIQKSTRELEMLGKTASQKFEAQLEFKGLDKAKFQPFLAELRKTEEAAAKAQAGVSGIGDAAKVAGSMMAAAFSGAALLGVVGKVVSVQREFDVLNSSLKTVTGSSAAAEREMAWLKDFAKETPFGLAQATQGFVKMKALGLDPTRAALTSFGNTASAMGKDLNQMIEAVADASTGEFERLKEFGIKAKKEGDNVSLTFQGVTTTIRNSAREITQYLEDIGNTSFGGAMEERAKTLDGTIAALGDTWDELFRTVSTNNVGGLIFDSVTLANGALEDATTIIRAMGGAVGETSREFGSLSAIQGGVAAFFETVSVLAANTLYVLRQTGDTMAGVAAGYKAFFSFDFDAVRAIGAEMKANGEAARKEIDATTARILNARKAQEEYARYATRNASAATDPRRVDLGGSAPRATTTSASSGAGRGVKETISEYDKLIKKLSDELPKAAAEAEAAQMGYNKAQTEFLTLAGSDVWASFTNSQRAVVASMFEGKIASEEAGEAAKALSKAYAEAAAERIKTIQSMERAADSLQSQNTALREEIELIGLSTEQQTLVLQQRNDVIILTKEATLAELERQSAITGTQTRVEIALASEIDALKERNALLGAKGVKNAAVDAAKSAADEWQKTSDKINDTLTDALMRGFESGKDFAKNLRDTVINMFKTMVLRPVISAIVNPVAGAVTGMMGLSGAAQAGQGGAGGANTVQTGFSALNGSISSTIGDAFSKFAGSSVGQSLGLSNAQAIAGNNPSAYVPPGGELSATGQQMSQALGVVGDTLAGYAMGSMARSLISNGYSVGKGMDNFQRAGIAVGSALGGPIAGAIIGAGAGVFNQLFGRKLKDSGIQGTFGGQSGFEGESFEFYKGGWFRSDKTKTKPLDEEVRKELGDAFGAMRAEVGTFATLLGLETDRLVGFTTSIKISTKGLDDKAAQEKIQEALATANNELAQQVIGSLVSTERRSGIFGHTITTATSYTPSEFAKDGEKAIDTLRRLATSLSTVNAIWENLGFTLYEGSLAGADAASKMADAFGGLENMAAVTGTYYENFYSEAEKTANVTRSVSDALAQVGLAMPTTRDEFRALVESQIALGDSGTQAVAALLGVSGAFASVTASAAEASEAARQLAEEQARAAQAAQDAAYSDFLRAVDRDRSSLQDQASILADTIGSIADAVSILKSNARELYGTVDSTSQMLAAQGMVYIENALSGVRAGGSVVDYTGLGDAIGAARGGIDSGTYATQFERDRDALVLAGQLSELGTLGDAQLSIEERQLRAINEQLEYLDDLSKRAEAMVSGTAALTGTVQSYFDKLLAFLAPSKGENNADGAVTVGGAPPGQLAPPAEFYREQVNALGGAWGKVPVRDAADVQYLRGVKAMYDAAPSAGYADLGDYFLDMRDKGVSMFDIGAATGHLYKDIKAAAAGFGIPAFAVGTNYVPRDMLAQIHEGEAIIPKAYNPAANTGMGGGNSEVVSELRALREENRQQAGEIARLNLRMARVLEKFDGDGMPATRDEAVV